jgi:hypothetical protein
MHGYKTFWVLHEGPCFLLACVGLLWNLYNHIPFCLESDMLHFSIFRWTTPVSWFWSKHSSLVIFLLNMEITVGRTPCASCSSCYDDSHEAAQYTVPLPPTSGVLAGHVRSRRASRALLMQFLSRREVLVASIKDRDLLARFTTRIPLIHDG